MKRFMMMLFSLGLLTLLWGRGLAAEKVTQLTFDKNQPEYLRDRGDGIPTSMFGTYIKEKQWIVYNFFEYYWDHDAEYSPAELGYLVDKDYSGKEQGYESLFYIAYAPTDRLALEFETAMLIKNTLTKDPNDISAMPKEITEAGHGDTEGQIRYRWAKETASRPGVFNYFEYVTPLQKNRKIIGTGEWELKLGAGLIKGFRFGTMTARLAFEHDAGEGGVEMGEFAVEHLKKLSDTWRVYTGLEGTQDEVEFIHEWQWHFNRHAYLKFNNAIGVTPKAVDYAPEVGIAYAF